MIRDGISPSQEIDIVRHRRKFELQLKKNILVNFLAEFDYRVTMLDHIVFKKQKI